VNCTGSCSWNIYVKDGIITWESQAVDYPSTGPDMPEYEPRGCPRGASFSCYTYSPLRLKHPYVRGSLLELYREARARLGDPVQAWAEIVQDPEKARRYKSQRGKGGFVRASWPEALELVAAATSFQAVQSKSTLQLRVEVGVCDRLPGDRYRDPVAERLDRSCADPYPTA
jgi:nitrate reductase / nitrite oxidoreductase, alpha subunit